MKKILAFVLAVVCVLSLAACNLSGAITYDIGNTDRANYFYKTYNRYVDMYGEAELKDGYLTGVAVVRLLDFTGDGVYELYMAYADGTKDYVNRQMVVGFDYGSAVLIGDTPNGMTTGDEVIYADITSKSFADAETPSIWLYKDNIDRAYIAVGEDLSKSADYITYVQTRGDEKIYSFQVDFTELDGNEPGGTFEKINLSDLTQEDAKLIFEENEKVVSSIKGQATDK
ncbi:MAG: hypothetical protein IJ298_09995 [Ruminococcus sp.]|nr:hypothetical protein [Ruminococcus sp.]